MVWQRDSRSIAFLRCIVPGHDKLKTSSSDNSSSQRASALPNHTRGKPTTGSLGIFILSLRTVVPRTGDREVDPDQSADDRYGIALGMEIDDARRPACPLGPPRTPRTHAVPVTQQRTRPAPPPAAVERPGRRRPDRVWVCAALDGDGRRKRDSDAAAGGGVFFNGVRESEVEDDERFVSYVENALPKVSLW